MPAYKCGSVDSQEAGDVEEVQGLRKVKAKAARA